jgi:hypothetical protein
MEREMVTQERIELGLPEPGEDGEGEKDGKDAEDAVVEEIVEEIIEETEEIVG